MNDASMTKKEREAAARLKIFTAKADDRPPQTDIDALLGEKPSTPPATPDPAPAPAKPEAPAKAAPVPKEGRRSADAEVVKPAKAKAGRRNDADAATPNAAAPRARPPAEPKAPADAESSKAAPETPPAPGKAAPWADAHPKVTTPFVLRMPEALHMKLMWLKDHMPNTSVQKLAIAAVEEKVEALLEEYYK
ncbi:MAG: hypothetical protein WKG03_00045 [Telluria sp.]